MEYNVLNKQEVQENRLIIREIRSYDYILSIPHAGLLIPVDFKDKFKLERNLLIGSDLHADALYDTDRGVKIYSKLSNYFLNLSRPKFGNKNSLVPLERDPLHGRFLDGNKALITDYTEEEANSILGYYDTFHFLLKDAIKEMQIMGNFALIIECHTFNSTGLEDTPDPGRSRADFNIGTNDGNSVDDSIVAALKQSLQRNHTVSINNPYKGGFITRKYGKPAEHTHVIQIETKKSLYMNESLTEGDFSVNSNFEAIKSVLKEAIESAAAAARKLYGNSPK